MSDIKFNCPSCKQSLEAPRDMAGQLIECPTCKKTIEIPIPRPPPESPPAVPPRPRPSSTSRKPPAPTTASQPAKRHGVFYYVFWGTVSLFATLGILAVGLFFFTAFGAGFLAAVSSQSEKPAVVGTTSVRLLPPLTEEESAQAARLRGTLESRRDEIEGITWLSPRVADGYKTAVYLYIGQKSSEPWLRWKIRYYGDDWLFVRRYRIKMDDSEPTTLLPTEEIDRDNSGGSVWETFDEPAIKHADIIDRILSSHTTYLRMQGSEGIKDVELGPSDIQKMRDVLLVFRSLGGKWPAE